MDVKPSQFHIKNAVSVKEIGYHEDKNYPSRLNMEDFSMCVDNFNGDGSGLFGIFDGHGGRQVSEYCSQVIPNIFECELDKKGSIKDVITRTLAKADDQLKLVGASDTGSTCCLVFVRKEGLRRMCYVANLGDTRAVLSIDGIAKRVSVDHKPTAQSQIQRIKKEGGIIIKGRVSGSLAVTRALGDLQLKSQGVSNIPDIEEFQITNKTNFLVVASDGLWDVCEDQKVVELCKTVEQANTMASTLVKYAKMNGSKDNVSVMILKF